MHQLIDTILSYYRTVLLLLAMAVIGGTGAYIAIAKEDSPDINLPLIYVGVTLDGISVEDADRLLARPIVQELNSLNGLKKTKSIAAEGYANIILEFDSDVNIDQALQDVRNKVDRARNDLPEDATEPKVEEINFSLFPVLTINLSGNIDERTLYAIADDLQNKLEAVPGVLEANLNGKREELVEIIIDPVALSSYKIGLQEITQRLAANNRLIAAGKLDTGSGRFAIKLPGLIEHIDDILDMPIKVSGTRVVSFRDIALVRNSFVDADSLSRVDGRFAVTIGIKKRIGANIIDTIDTVKSIIALEQKNWPEDLEVGFIQDQSQEIHQRLNELFNNVLAATFLVVMILILAIGINSALLVGMSIPVSFLMSILILYLAGLTVNMVVLFALILSVGMLIDGALVVVEYADRKISEGSDRFHAYAEAAKKMSWPVICSTLTTLVVFATLLFWPDTVGDFMWYIPITVITTLVSALVVALIVLPVLGSLLDKSKQKSLLSVLSMEQLRWNKINKTLTSQYLFLLVRAVRYPWATLALSFVSFICMIVLYNFFGKGVEFFPSIEPKRAVVYLRSAGNFSLQERDQLTRRVEEVILPMGEIQSLATKVVTQATGENEPDDLIASIALEFVPWSQRRSAEQIKTEIREKTQNIPGLILEIAEEKAGPQSEADIMIEIGSASYQQAMAATAKITDMIRTQYADITDLRDSRPAEGIEWQIKVDRQEAARYGLDTTQTGNMLQMITEGMKVGEYLPKNAEEEIDIRMRFPVHDRNLEQIDHLKITVQDQSIPISNYITKEAKPRSGQLVRVNGQFVYEIQMNLAPGTRIDQRLQDLEQLLNEELPEGVSYRFRGDKESQDEAFLFLIKAFGTAIFLMIVILVTQYNSFYQALLTLTAVIFSTMGVLAGLMLRGEAFGIVMSGVGVIALAGIVVNNNIILIDQFNDLCRQGMHIYEAILRTGQTRLRPVVLTSITTIFGLLPMVFQLNIDFFSGNITIGAPSTQWWVQLSTAIAGGLAFATVFTLFLTPALLYLGRRHKT